MRTVRAPMRRIVVPLICAAATLVLVTTTAWALITPTKVLLLPGSQYFPFSNGTYLAYTSNSKAKPKHYNAYARRDSDGKTFRINEPNTEGFDGGFDPGTDTAVYQQIQRRTSDIYTYNLDTRTRHKLPKKKVNTPKWEWDPRISTSFISFFRDAYDSYSGKWYTHVFIYDRVTDRTREIPGAGYPAGRPRNGSVGERYATWDVCGKQTCSVYLFDMKTRTPEKIPSAGGLPQYAPVVDETNGLLFFARSGFGCGKGVKIDEVPVATPRVTPTEVATLPRGIDLADGASLALNTGTNMYDYFFSQVRCPNHPAHIYAFEGVSPGP